MDAISKKMGVVHKDVALAKTSLANGGEFHYIRFTVVAQDSINVMKLALSATGVVEGQVEHKRYEIKEKMLQV